MRDPDLAFLQADEQRLAYRLRAGRGPTLVFLPGYASDMEGGKATAVDRWAGERGQACLRLDYSGTGSSPGAFADGTLHKWIDDALAAIDQLTDGRLILVGSSMGGWIALHLALQRPERIAALVGIAAAPDFTDWGFGPAQRTELARAGFLGPADHRIHHAFWTSGQALRLLGGKIGIDCPVRLLHGTEDRDVPPDVAHRLMRALRSADVQLTLVKGGGHRLSEPHEIAALLQLLGALLEPTA